MVDRYESEAARASPAKIGRYVIQGILGQGVMGVVHRGYDPQLDRKVAIKTIRTELLSHDLREELLARFCREARAAGRFVHPNVVAVFDFDGAHEPPYIAMELVEGRSLADLRQTGFRFTLPQCRSIMTQILSALDCAHHHGVVHRDIKPANVLVRSDNQIKVADFGVARFSTPELTQFGGIVGTPIYMAPEQLEGRVEDHRCDIFSAGVMLYELLTSRRPHAGSTPTDILNAILAKRRPDPLALVPGLPPAVRDVLNTALATSPDERFQAASAFRKAIETSFDESLSSGERSDSETLIEAAQVLSELPETPPLTTYDPAVYRHIERDLARVVGPIASVMLKRALRATTDPDLLYIELSEEIPNGDGAKFRALGQDWRERLRRELRLGREPGTGTEAMLGRAQRDTPSLWSGIGDRFNTADLDAAKQALTVYCGPIATVLVRNAARYAQSLPQLYDALAAHIDSVADRNNFLDRASRS